MKTVNEVVKLAGVSVRTLHHYDSIGLLKPAAVTDAGYRMYDDKDIEKLGSIMLLRELEFPLKDIAEILNNPSYNSRAALREQIELLQLKRNHIDGILDYAKRLLDGEEEKTVNFDIFDTSAQQQYAAEAKERWGQSDAYAEYEQRGEKSDSSADDLMAIFGRFGSLLGGDPASERAIGLVEELKSFITKHYYTCTDEILASLGRMYTADSRFKANIDKIGGAGTADFASAAIAAYVAR